MPSSPRRYAARFISASLIALLWMGMVTSVCAQTTTTSQIRLNQVGFYPQMLKKAAVVDAPSGIFHVLTADLADTVFTGNLSGSLTWSAASESARMADFTDLETTGDFVLAVPDLGISYPFSIRPHIHQEVARAALKAYYFQRVSTALAPAYAGRWSRPAGHPDDEVLIHPSAASEGRPAGTIISAPRGWYDAGDFNKYIVNSGISTGTLLMLYEHYPEYFAEFDVNIPESGDSVPDLLDEALWNIRWMLAMQDPGDGGVYHKLTTPNFEGVMMPHQAAQQRYVVQKSTAATLNFAAVMALGARIFDDFGDEFPGLADSMLTAAQAAWNWAQFNPGVPYDQSALNQAYDPDINTGTYGDNDFFDEFRWAAAELFITTKQDSFVVMYPPWQSGNLQAPGWPYVDPLAYISLAFHADDVEGTVDIQEIRSRITTLANSYLAIQRDSAFDIVMGNSGDFFWGSNSLAANQAMMLLQAYRITDDNRYLEAALSNLDYLLGRNGTGYSFVTGVGDRTPRNPHHRQSEADNIADPVPGFLVGGPNSGRQDGCTYPFTQPAKSYVDDFCSYASNEVTINWNAPLLYVAGALEAILSPTGKPVGREETGSAVPGFRIESFPNPVVNMARIRYWLDEPARVTLRTFDILGREMARLVDGRMVAAGRHEAELNVTEFPPGLYFVRMESGRSVRTHSFIVVN